jgi:polyphosphate kinase
LAPVEAPGLQAELEDTLERCFADDTFAWELQPDWSWKRREGGERSVHAELRERALERAASAEAADVPSESPAGAVQQRA